MTNRIVTNTSPLLSLSKMRVFETIGKLPFEFICPAEVEAEILAGANQGYDVEIPASFPDGQEGLKKFIGQNIVRPKNSRGETVLVRFMVERYGEISKVHVLASPAAPRLSAEAIKVVKKMGSWNPAKIQGIEVASYYVLPIKF